MAETAIFDPIVVEPDLTSLKIRELLERGSESAKLDYKREYNPSDTTAKVELVKDLVAMANTAGGYLVIGVADDGSRVGLNAGAAAKIDEATVRAQVAGYVSIQLAIFVNNQIDHEGLRYAFITVLPLLKSIAVFEAAGNRPTGKALFRQGDVVVRHGSASEVWNQRDVEYLLRRTLDHRKEEWLSELGKDLRLIAGLSGARRPPVSRATFESSAEEFQQTVLELMRGESDG